MRCVGGLSNVGKEASLVYSYAGSLRCFAEAIQQAVTSDPRLLGAESLKHQAHVHGETQQGSMTASRGTSEKDIAEVG
ncbi:unnamed protein product [Jaminaea pallidilutea]